MRVDAEEFTIDGICFNDLKGYTIAQQRILIARDCVWLTRLPQGYFGLIIAPTRRWAEDIAFGRGLDETVVAQLQLVHHRKPS